MKKALLILGLAVGAAFSASAQTEIPNGSFEDISGGKLNNWVVKGGVATLVDQVKFYKPKTGGSGVDTIIRPVYAGKYALAIQGQGTTRGIVAQTFAISSRPKFIGGSYAFFATAQNEKTGIRLVMMDSTTNDTVLSQIFIAPVGQNTGTIEPWATYNLELTNFYDSTKSGVTPNKCTIELWNTLAGVGGLPGSAAATVFWGEVNFFTSAYTSVRENTVSLIPADASVYPNPTSGNTNFKFSLNSASQVTLTVMDMSGRVMAEVANGTMTAGEHVIPFNGSDLSNGVYIYRLQAGNEVKTGKLIISE